MERDLQAEKDKERQIEYDISSRYVPLKVVPALEQMDQIEKLKIKEREALFNMIYDKFPFNATNVIEIGFA